MVKNKYCDLCESTKCDKGLHKRIEKSLQQCKEGRTYTMSCSHYKGKGFFVCEKCVTRDCRRWYKLGVKDGKRKQ